MEMQQSSTINTSMIKLDFNSASSVTIDTENGKRTVVDFGVNSSGNRILIPIELLANSAASTFILPQLEHSSSSTISSAGSANVNIMTQAPNTVTDEQREFARGFENELNNIRRSSRSSKSPVGSQMTRSLKAAPQRTEISQFDEIQRPSIANGLSDINSIANIATGPIPRNAVRIIESTPIFEKSVIDINTIDRPLTSRLDISNGATVTCEEYTPLITSPNSLILTNCQTDAAVVNLDNQFFIIPNGSNNFIQAFLLGNPLDAHNNEMKLVKLESISRLSTTAPSNLETRDSPLTPSILNSVLLPENLQHLRSPVAALSPHQSLLLPTFHSNLSLLPLPVQDQRAPAASTSRSCASAELSSTQKSCGEESSSDDASRADQSDDRNDDKKLKNRLAARKCRQKKLQKISNLEDEVGKLRTMNVDLKRKASNLNEQVVALKQRIVDHRRMGCQVLLAMDVDF